jgi:guanylate kinase
MILGLRLAVSAASQCLRRQQCPFANSGACRKALVTGTGDKVHSRRVASACVPSAASAAVAGVVHGNSAARELASLIAALPTEPLVPLPSPLVLIISGPSGVGKDSVIKRLQEVLGERLHFVTTATSRPPRPGEVHGVDYFFVGREEFERMIHDDELVEHAMVYGEHKGIPKSQIAQQIARGGDVVLRLDVQGAATVRIMLPQAVSVFITAESEAALAQRLVGRKTEPPSRLLERVATARGELTHMDEFDYVVCNSAGQMERTVHELCAIIDTEKLRLRERSYDL